MGSDNEETTKIYDSGDRRIGHESRYENQDGLEQVIPMMVAPLKVLEVLEKFFPDLKTDLTVYSLEHKHENDATRCRELCPREVHRCTAPTQCEPGKCPPCSAPLNFKIACGHLVEIICSEDDPEEGDIACYDDCNRFYPLCGHPCDKLCWEECGVCEVLFHVY